MQLEVKQAINRLHKKYWDLVWYARSDPECYPGKADSLRAGVFMAHAGIEAAYPDEVNDLLESDDNWEHGFNSGCLAMLNYLLMANSFGVEAAEDDFPNLDT